MKHISIASSSRQPIPRWPYERMAVAILGTNYELSVLFVGSARATSYNKTYRHKDYAPDVLAFPLSETVGQIVICPIVAKTKAAEFGLSYTQYLGFLFIHACLHLTGYDHGTKMDNAEKRFCAQFKILHPTEVLKT